MAIILECVACGKLSVVVAATPPLCAHCGCGNGPTVEIAAEDMSRMPDASKSKKKVMKMRRRPGI
jgi:hypothetical protein